MQLVQEAAFGEGTALGSPLFGDAFKLSVVDILAYRSAHFVQENLIVAGSGISQDRLKALLQHHVARLPNGAAAPAAPGLQYVGGELKVRTDLGGASQLAVAFPIASGSVGKVDTRSYVLACKAEAGFLVAGKVLVAALNRRLTQQQVCAEAFLHGFRHGGILGIRATGSSSTATAQLQSAVTALKALSSAADLSAARTKVHCIL